MSETVNAFAATESTYDDEQIWNDLFTWLLAVVEKWVLYADVSCWRGQQREVSEDIAQEALLRTFKYTQRAQQGEVQPVVSLKSLSKVIAQNYFRDRRRKDQLLVRPFQNEESEQLAFATHDIVDPAEIALDHLIFCTAIVMAAQVVAQFPLQQRTALLTDLANISDFDAPPTLLEQSLSIEGIRLRDYHRPLPTEPAQRGRFAAHLCIAYKRLRKKVEV
jgi:DNA-directed RNA polymerase specialized sigma24 family protein